MHLPMDFPGCRNDESGTAKSSTVTVGTLKTNVSGEVAAYSGHLSSIYLNGGKVGKRSQLTINGNVDVTTKIRTAKRSAYVLVGMPI